MINLEIKINFLGSPKVFVDKKRIYFPYKKAEALFYYLYFKKSSSRNSLTEIFWCDFDEKSAKKNLRDALYKIKKTFGFDILISPKRASLMINTEYNISSDIDDFDKNNAAELYKGDFLENFVVKDCYGFEEWLYEKREHYKKIYIDAIKEKLYENMNYTGIKDIEYYANIILKENPFDEKNYRDIMKIYSFRGDFNRALSLYYELSDLLKEELDVAPQPATKKIFNEILELRSFEAKEEKKDKTFIGRYEEFHFLKTHLDNFVKNNSKSLFISGEAGIGKSTITDKFIDLARRKKISVFKSQCFEAEQNYFLKPWDDIFSQISGIIKEKNIKIPPLWEDVVTYIFPSFNLYNKPLKIDSIEKIESVKYKVTFDAVLKILEKISLNNKIIILFEDIQWMDSFSLNLITTLIPKLHNIMFYCTYRNSHNKELEPKILPTLKRSLGESLELKRLTKEQTNNFIKEYSSNSQLDKNILDKIYSETEGNPLFITESLKLLKEYSDLNHFSDKMENIIKSRLYSLSYLEKKVLDIASMFFDQIDLDFILKILKEEQFEVFDALESLQDKQLINEYTVEGSIFYKFTHSKFREYIYLNQPEVKKQVLHSKIAEFLEEKLYGDNRDRHLYPKIIYHYSNSNNIEKNLEYTIKNLSLYSSVKYEMYPSFYNYQDILQDKFNIEESFNEVENLLNKCKEKSLSYTNYKMKFLYIKGRYNISNGNYKEGLKNIHEFIDYAEKIDDKSNRIDGYKQMIFYGIQVNNTIVMNKYIKNLQEVINEKEDLKEKGNLYRFKGLYNIKTKKYDTGEKHLRKSIKIFENLNKINNSYVLNIAACYNYLGNINKFKENYEDALKHYQEAINLCESNNIVKGLDVFYTEAGQVCYELDKFEMSADYIKKALNYFEKYENIWGRAIAEGYYSLLLSRNGKKDSAKKHLELGEKYAEKMNNPYSINLIKKIKKQI